MKHAPAPSECRARWDLALFAPGVQAPYGTRCFQAWLRLMHASRRTPDAEVHRAQLGPVFSGAVHRWRQHDSLHVECEPRRPENRAEREVVLQ
eukprot:4908535-Pleurochrysis_carterae.AAC.4